MSTKNKSDETEHRFSQADNTEILEVDKNQEKTEEKELPDFDKAKEDNFISFEEVTDKQMTLRKEIIDSYKPDELLGYIEDHIAFMHNYRRKIMELDLLIEKLERESKETINDVRKEVNSAVIEETGKAKYTNETQRSMAIETILKESDLYQALQTTIDHQKKEKLSIQNKLETEKMQYRFKILQVELLKSELNSL